MARRAAVLGCVLSFIACAACGGKSPGPGAAPPDAAPQADAAIALDGDQAAADAEVGPASDLETADIGLACVPTTCDDGNPCTVDTCVTGACVHANTTGVCDDDNACTTSDVCQDGSCVGMLGACGCPATVDLQETYIKASNTQSLATFGCGVAIDGDTMVVGARGEGSGAKGIDGDQYDYGPPSYGAMGSGAAYVFVRKGGVWTQQAYLKASNADAADWFGTAVALSGDTIVVGAPQEGSGASYVNATPADNSAPNSGAAYVFVRSGGVWTQQAYLKASNPSMYARFGGSVAIDGETIVVGASEESSDSTGIGGKQLNNNAPSSGAAYVFVRQGGKWTQQAYVKASNAEAGDYFGGGVSLSGDTLAVSAPWEGSAATGIDGNQADNTAKQAGAVYVFVRQAGAWTQQAYLKASDTAAGAYFGGSISVSGDTVAVGMASDTSSKDGGVTHVFERKGTSWQQKAYLKASNSGAKDGFGSSVALSGDNLLIGAAGEASKATGIGGKQFNHGAPGSGAAYLFVRKGGPWLQGAYLKASNTGAGNAFGASVAISDGSMVVGALQEDSTATGVGVPSDSTSSMWSGAAYVFTLNETCDDGNPCTNDACVAGACVHTNAFPACDDSNPCTDDTCAGGVCGHVNNSLGCDDGDACTLEDGCEGGACVGTAKDCADVSPCTTDTCAGGICAHANNSSPCDDGNGCTGGDVCMDGLCAGTVGDCFCFATAALQQAYIKASNAEAGDGFGYRVGIDGDTVVVGAPYESSGATGVGGDQGDNSAIGSGAAYVFVRKGNVWTQQAYLKASVAVANQQFGSSVAISGDTIVVCASKDYPNYPPAPDSGAAFVFVRKDGAWTQQAVLPAPASVNSAGFGQSVALSGDTLVVGALWSAVDASGNGSGGTPPGTPATGSGSAYVFVRQGTAWAQQATLHASNAASAWFFGISVDISGDTVVVGADGESSKATGVNGDATNTDAYMSGAAYVFVRKGSNWTQQAYLKASNTDAGDWFGYSVSVSGDTIVVGALKEASNATGVNGNQTDNSTSYAGAAYVFVRDAGQWSQQAYLKRSSAEGFGIFGSRVDSFGDTAVVADVAKGSNGATVFARKNGTWAFEASVNGAGWFGPNTFAGGLAISGDTVAIGADLESSAATGLGGSPANNSALQSGAVYVHVLNQSCDDSNACTNDACVAGACVHTNNTAPCVSGTCSGGQCN